MGLKVREACLILLTGFAAMQACYAQNFLQAIELEENRKDVKVRTPRYDSLVLKANFIRIKQIVGYGKQYHDSTASIVFDRNGWDNICLVTDWTASMLAHDAMMLRWHFRNQGRISHFCIFNDGDSKYDDEKEIGLTGGIYHCAGNDSLEIWETLERCVKAGNGGDHRENVIEALLDANLVCSSGDELVLVADNSAPIRDLALLNELDRPIRIVLVGVYKEGVHTDYINLAFKTRGSLHTKDFDLIDFQFINPGHTLAILDTKYELRNGSFIRKSE